MSMVIRPCCDSPRLRLTRDERVTYAATRSDDGALVVEDIPMFVSGQVFDDDDEHLYCANCGRTLESEPG